MGGGCRELSDFRNSAFSNELILKVKKEALTLLKAG